MMKGIEAVLTALETIFPYVVGGLLALVLLALVTTCQPPRAYAGPPDVPPVVLVHVPWTPNTEDGRTALAILSAAEAHGVPAGLLACALYLESRWDSHAVGELGEVGAAQLLPSGELISFHQRGYSDPWSVDQAADFMALRISEGYGHYWTGVRRCQ